MLPSRLATKADLAPFLVLRSDEYACLGAFLCHRDGLFAAAGVKMASSTPKARQSMLAEVPKALATRQHVNLDSGSSERLVAAAENR